MAESEVLTFDPTWRFLSPGKIAGDVIPELIVVIKRVSGRLPNRQTIIEHHKKLFRRCCRPAVVSQLLAKLGRKRLNEFDGHARQYTFSCVYLCSKNTP
jgi:hypothetical protein